MAKPKSYLSRYRTQPVYVVCPVCRWESHRTWKPCDQDHVGPCSCHYGLCRKCGGRVTEGSAWRKVCDENINPPCVSGVVIRLLPGTRGYGVGDDGSVWSCRVNSGRCDASRWRKLKPVRIGRDHWAVGIVKDGVRKLCYVHRLVLETFVGPRPPGMEGCHFPDRDPANNRLNNLRWDTRQANVNDMIAHGTHPRGSSHGRAKLCEEDIAAIRLAHEAGETIAGIARRYSVDWGTIDLAVKRKNWRHV